MAYAFGQAQVDDPQTAMDYQIMLISREWHRPPAEVAEWDYLYIKMALEFINGMNAGMKTRRELQK